MRLLHTRRLTLTEFPPIRVPEYAILSHTWSGDEVLYREFYASDIRSQERFDKIKNVCKLAQELGYEWIWVDACFTNDGHDGERASALRKMFSWYEGAKVCFVFPSDYAKAEHEEPDLSQCRWFPRAWTLQELLAPEQVIFHDKSCQRLGSRTALASHISSFTTIDAAF